MDLAKKRTQSHSIQPLRGQLLKWVGNKQKFAFEIASFFPNFNRYFEPFLGSAAVLGTLGPEDGFASDAFSPLIEIWQTLKANPRLVYEWYEDRYLLAERIGKKEAYERILASYNKAPNAADFLFLTRTCYGGVVRFRKADGYMSTPCGPHSPIPPHSFSSRVQLWSQRIAGTQFEVLDFREAMSKAGEGDMIYCDPPYVDSQAILYGAQSFKLRDLYCAIAEAKERGAFIALSIDGTKQSGRREISVSPPRGLFEREVFIEVGRSMLKRFQSLGQDVSGHKVQERLLLTF